MVNLDWVCPMHCKAPMAVALGRPVKMYVIVIKTNCLALWRLLLFNHCCSIARFWNIKKIWWVHLSILSRLTFLRNAWYFWRYCGASIMLGTILCMWLWISVERQGNLTKLMQMQLDHTSVQLGSNLFIDAFCTLQGNKKLHSLASLCMMICTFKEENLNIEMGAIVYKTKISIIIVDMRSPVYVPSSLHLCGAKELRNSPESLNHQVMIFTLQNVYSHHAHIPCWDSTARRDDILRAPKLWQQGSTENAGADSLVWGKENHLTHTKMASYVLEPLHLCALDLDIHEVFLQIPVVYS